MTAAGRIGLDRWRHVVKLDPDKPLPAHTVRRIAASGTDAVLIGGSQRLTRAKVLRLLWRLRHAPVPVCIEVTAMACAVPGADAYLVPLVLNTADPRWLIGQHLDGLARVGSRVPWDRVLAEGYVIGNAASAAGRRAQVEEPPPDRLPPLVQFAAGILDLPVLYLEYSGRFAPDGVVAAAAGALEAVRAGGSRSRLFYGGGIGDYAGARTRLRQVDTIVIGNALYGPRGLEVLEETLAAPGPIPNERMTVVSEPTVYLNGQYVPYSQAVVPVEDRAFLFADGIYEVVRCYGGRPFHLERHFQRLRDSADGLDLPLPLDEAGYARIVAELLERNRLREATVYLQVTRGVAPRQHQFPREVTPTVVAFARPAQSPPEDRVRAGVAVITVPDTRWGLCYLKTVGLLPNVLARQQAEREGVFDAVFVRDGLVTEATSSNVFCVLDGIAYTHPLANILPGVTRAVVLEILDELGIPCREEAVPLQRFRAADEIFLTGTNLEVIGVSQVDGRPVGAGRTGPLTLRVWDAFRQRCASL